MTTLRELIEQANADLDRYKHPDTHEVERRLDEILTAGKLGSIRSDNLESLGFYRGMVSIQTSYSVRGCSQSGDYKFPESIVDADDPIAAIKVWAKEQRVAKAKADLAGAERQVEWYRQQVIKAEQED